MEEKKIGKREAQAIAAQKRRQEELEKVTKLKEDNVPGIRVSENKGKLKPVGKREAKILAQKREREIMEHKKRSVNILAKEEQEINNIIAKKKKTNKKKIKTRSKPRILLITDVKGWAWWIKSQYLIKYLSEEFDFHVMNYLETRKRVIKAGQYDLYFTFGYSYASKINHVDKKRRITGVTAHRNKNVIVPKMKLAGTVHANSILLYNELKKWGLKNIFYVPNGVDEELFKPINPIPLKRDNIIVGHIGKHSPRKGQDKFIKPAIKKAKAQSFFHMNKYTNKIPHNKMVNLYQNMDVFIVASEEDGTPNPALEAAACGRPIISNRIGNMPEFIENGYNGFLVEKKVDAYVEKINYLRNNRDKLIEMGQNARKTVEEDWTWKIQAERYRVMFRDALERCK